MDGIQGIHGAYLYPPAHPLPPAPHRNEPAPKSDTPEASPEISRKTFDELQAVSRLFNTRLEYRYHEGLKQVVVKVIDATSDTVVKELPSAELQAVHLRLREALGVLIDRRI